MTNVRKILGFEIPEGQRLWFWNVAGECGTLLLAADEEEAYRKAIKARIGESVNPEDIESAVRWFRHNDTIEEVVTEYTGPAFDGPLQDEDEQ